MAIDTQSPAPYTAGAALLTVMRRFRDRGLTTPFTPDVLVRAGVPESLVGRTVQALQTLDLMDDKGAPTETFQRIRLASEKDYKTVLAEWLRSAYAEIFQFVDPSADDASAIRDAFRAYTPHGQQDRMVALFLALCAEAGLVDESKKSELKPAARKPPLPLRAAPRATRVATPRSSSRSAVVPVAAGTLPPALAGLMQSLPPPEVGWTKDQRDRFMETFKSVLDFVVPIVAAVKREPGEGNP